MAGCLKCSCYYIEPHPQVSTFASNTGSNVTKSPAYATASEMGAEKDSTTLKLGEIYSDKLSSHSLGVYVRFRDSHRDVCQRMLAVTSNPEIYSICPPRSSINKKTRPSSNGLCIFTWSFEQDGLIFDRALTQGFFDAPIWHHDNQRSVVPQKKNNMIFPPSRF